MTNLGWSLVDVASQLLGHEEREVVRGDLVEAGENAWRALLEVVGLVVRREAAVWKSWRPWLAAFGLALPSSFLLMGFSVSVSLMYVQLTESIPANGVDLAVDGGFWPLICQALLLLGCSWTGGYVVGSLSKRTVWMSAILCCSPCLFCLSRFGIPSLSRFCLLLFLLPAIAGVRQGLRTNRMKLGLAISLAILVTVFMTLAWSSKNSLILNAALVWPTWYMVATAHKTRQAPTRA